MLSISQTLHFAAYFRNAFYATHTPHIRHICRTFAAFFASKSVAYLKKTPL